MIQGFILTIVHVSIVINLDKIHKSYRVANDNVVALDAISLQVPKGQIYGIIGHSGAGKSTLVRCLNLLERPTSGTILIDNVDMINLSPAALNQMRRKVSMIFQHFNLLSSQTIFDNIAFPLRLEKWPKAKIKARVDELLVLVGLSDHADKYPAQLSGGQKQRVGIARALANSPSVLLCDEATSALDPHTTQAILELLSHINKTLNLTIVLITHEMEVIRKICHQVAVIHGGMIVESGPVEQIFLHPVHPVTQSFIRDTSKESELKQSIEYEKKMGVSIFQITYSGDDAFSPHLSEVVKESGVGFSILSGNIGYIRDLPYGQLIVALSGDSSMIELALNRFKARNITCQSLNDLDE